MSSDIMTFYVRIILPTNQVKLFLSLTDLNIKVQHFTKGVLNDLKSNGNEEFAEELEELLNSKFILCWNRKYPIEIKFINLLSKVEKSEGKEIDVFELEFTN